MHGKKEKNKIVLDLDIKLCHNKCSSIHILIDIDQIL